jgi:beta-phosphoglucomutase family hydrolase
VTFVLGLPTGIHACLFDLDGVLTPTAAVHAAAWTEMFDGFLRTRAERTGEPFVPFDPVADYDEYVDGKARADGTRAFLASRRITLPEGEPDDPPDRDTIEGLSARKDEVFLRRVHRDGVKPYEGSVRYLHAARDAGLRPAVVSSSTHCAEIVRAAGIEDLLEVRVDGLVARAGKLAGKPAPDMYLAAARKLDVAPAQAAVFEDALAGVAAGRAGGFGYTVGVDRAGQADALRAHGADIVVTDLAELLDQP